MSFEWPTEKVDLNRAAELITAAGKSVSRSSLSRFVASRNFPFAVDGHRKLVDAKALYEAYIGDFTREVMAGESGSAPQKPASAAPPRDRSNDPKYREAELKVISAELDLAERLAKTIPADEVDAAAAESMAVLRTAFAEVRSDTASRIVEALKLPEHASRIIREELKRFEREGQEKAAAIWARLATADGQTEAETRARHEQLVRLALKLRGEEEETPAAEPEAVATAG